MKTTTESGTIQSKWVMDCNTEAVKETINSTLHLIDDLQGKCTKEEDLDHLSDLYDEIEAIKFSIKDTVSIETRNSIRMTCKYLMKITPFLN